jgi:superfamily II DNA or RNA helicase
LAIVENEYRNSIVKKLVEHHDKEKVLILTKYINQAKKISEILDVPVMWNKTKLKERQRLLKEFDFGDIDVLVASRILDEGIDIKNVNVVIIASAGDRFEKTIQRLGRGLRVTKKKKSVIIYDFWDETHSVLLRHSKNRKKDYITFGYDDIINIKQEEDIDLYLRLRSM